MNKLYSPSELNSMFESFTKEWPWQTDFIIDDNHYGGPYSYTDDPRVSDFLSWTPPESLSTVLELASCEAGQTLEIMKSCHVNKVIGLEGKDYLVEKSRFIGEIVLPKPSEFIICNFDKDQIPVSADSCFCSGVLYHLNKPWELIYKISEKCKYLYLATHYTISSDSTVYNYNGRYSKEPESKGPWAGITEYSFWFTLPSLIKCLMDAKWSVLQMRNWPCWHPTLDPAPMVGMLCEVNK